MGGGLCECSGSEFGVGDFAGGGRSGAFCNGLTTSDEIGNQNQKMDVEDRQDSLVRCCLTSAY